MKTSLNKTRLVGPGLVFSREAEVAECIFLAAPELPVFIRKSSTCDGSVADMNVSGALMKITA